MAGEFEPLFRFFMDNKYMRQRFMMRQCVHAIAAKFPRVNLLFGHQIEMQAYPTYMGKQKQPDKEFKT